MTAILEAAELVKVYPVRDGDGRLRAVDGVSFSLRRGETLGVVGESGCGKSTAARLLVRLEDPSSGRVLLDGEDITSVTGRDLRAVRRRIQLVFQDPYASLNPRQTVGETLLEVLEVHSLADDRNGRRRRVLELLDMVGLAHVFAARYPHQMSGGQRQRVGVARALAVEPDVLVLDEPVSALDVSVQAEVMNLLTRLRAELELTYVFISHDLGMVRHISDRIAVMYLGRIVELGAWRRVSDDPMHPYTRALQQAVPVPDPDVEVQRTVRPLRGEVPDPADPPDGCNFHPRCPLVEPICREVDPPLGELLDGHRSACHVAAHAIEQGRGQLPEPDEIPESGLTADDATAGTS